MTVPENHDVIGILNVSDNSSFRTAAMVTFSRRPKVSNISEMESSDFSNYSSNKNFQSCSGVKWREGSLIHIVLSYCWSSALCLYELYWLNQLSNTTNVW